VKYIFMALGLVLVVVCVMVCAANPMAQTGALVGLLVGVVSGPLRVAAVDFRQWLRDPGEPAEASDDSPYGLGRDVFISALYGAVVFLLFVSLVLPTLYAQSAWSPPDCEAVFAPSAGFLRDWGVFATLDRWGIGAFFSECMGVLYGFADVAEDIKLRAILDDRRAIVDPAEAAAANALTRVKFAAIALSVVGALMFAVLTVVDRLLSMLLGVVAGIT
jgi:hypothetical protein